LPDDDLVTITVTDLRHPLYGRSFVVVSVTGVPHGQGQVYVDYRGHILLKVPIAATSLRPACPAAPVSKLSRAAIRDLLHVAASGPGANDGAAPAPPPPGSGA
jgi:hypothetical protein